MTANRNVEVPPVPENVKHKTDVLEWGNVPPGACELGFRPSFSVKSVEQAVPVLLLGLASLLAVPASWAVGKFIAPQVSSWPWAAAAVVLGFVLAIRRQLSCRTSSPSTDSQRFDPTTLLYLLTPLFVWAATALTAGLSHVSGAFAYVAVAVLLNVVVADRLATHAVYWMTSNLHVDHATMASWRDDWGRRLLGTTELIVPSEEAQSHRAQPILDAVFRARAGYPVGFLWIAAAFVVPALPLLCLSSVTGTTTIGLQLVAGSCCGLILVALVRCEGNSRIASALWKTFLHWSHYGKASDMPPWMFHSPCGGHWRRRVGSMIAAAMLSVVFVHLAAHSTPALTSFSVERHASVTPGEHVKQPRMSSPTQAEPHGLFRGLIAIAVVGLISLTLPVLAHLLTLLILVGPIIHAYHEALET